MEIKTNGEYNPCQVNFTINLSPDDKILSKSLMLNLRGETPKKVYEAFQELRRLIDGREEKKVKDNPEKTKRQTKKEEKGNNPGTCPSCGAALIHRSGISKNGVAYNFLGCSAFPICTYSRNIPDKEEIPTEEDLMTIYAE